MSAQAVQTEIIEPMQRIYHPPRKMDDGQQAEALREYVGALQDFEDGDLKAAWSRVRDTHDKYSWPVPAAFVLAARVVRKERDPAAGVTRKATADSAAVNWDRWLQVRGSDKAKEAAKRGVAWAFRCAILDGKIATEISLTELERAKNRAERLASAIEDGHVVTHQGRELRFSDQNATTALKMWRNIQIREAETQQEIRHAAIHG